MEDFLLRVAAAAVALFASEMALCLLPEGNMKKFGKFVVGILLCLVLLSAVTQPPEVDLTLETSAAPEVYYESYEDIIMDVYNRYLQNNNN